MIDTTVIHMTVLDTPIGPLSLLTLDRDGTETLVASGFTADPRELHARLHPSMRSHEPAEAAEIGEIGRAHQAYFAGVLTALDSVPVHQPGSARRERLWAALREVPAGHTVTYAELAIRAGLERAAARAAGQACSQNLVAPVVPCHRVLPASGPRPYGHYLYGVDRKEWLLRHEAAAG